MHIVLLLQRSVPIRSRFSILLDALLSIWKTLDLLEIRRIGHGPRSPSVINKSCSLADVILQNPPFHREQRTRGRLIRRETRSLRFGHFRLHGVRSPARRDRARGAGALTKYNQSLVIANGCGLVRGFVLNVARARASQLRGSLSKRHSDEKISLFLGREVHAAPWNGDRNNEGTDNWQAATVAPIAAAITQIALTR